MNLLITTQAVDLDDPILGFMHRWIEELSKRFDKVHVICLKEGRHDLPKNVFVHSLGKESGASRVKYVTRFYRYIREFRGQYDTVFVHMNAEYVCLGGPLWRAWGKHIVLWRNHKVSGLSTSIAVRFSDAVCYTSASSFVSKFKNAVKMPIGIDTDLFKPASVLPKQGSILFLGRLDPVKKVAEFVRALNSLHEKGIAFSATIIGDPTDPKSNYAHDVRNSASALALDGTIAMRPGVTNDAARELFASHAIYCNLTPSGSFDKTIGEAMASGATVVVANDAVRGAVPSELIVDPDSVESVAKGIRAALEMPEGERQKLALSGRDYIVREHSLALLIERLSKLLAV